MNKSIANWNYLFTGTKQGLILQSTSTSSQSYSHSKSRFFFFFLNHHHSCFMNKSSSFLVHLHLLHFVIIKKKKKSQFSKGKFSIFQRKNLQNHVPKGKSPMNKSWIKISKTSMEKSLRINFQGKISMNKSSLKKFSKV